MTRLTHILSMAGALVAALSCNRTNPPATATVANPTLGDVCARDGKLAGVVNGVCPLHRDGWDWDSEMTPLEITADQSALPACPLGLDEDLKGLDVPGWSLRIDEILGPELAAGSGDHHHTVAIATRLDVTPPCAVRLVWKVKQHGVNLQVGATVRYARRITIRSVEDDVTVTAVLRDEQGGFLLGHSSGVRPATWDQDMWPELALAVDPGLVCREERFPGVQRLRFTLASGADRCTLEAASARCCTFGNKVHLVLATDAVRNTTPQAAGSSAGPPVDNVTVLVARQGLLTPIP